MMEPELMIFLQMLLTRLLHCEKMLDLLISSDNMQKDAIIKHPLMKRYATLQLEQKDKLMDLATRIMAMYTLPPILEEKISNSEQKTEDLQNISVLLEEKKTIA